MPLQVTRLTEPLKLGEGPHWDEKTKSLYFVDIQDYSIHKFVPATNTHTSAKVGDKGVSLILPVENQKNKFIITSGCDIATITWDGVSKTVSDFQVLKTVEAYPELRFNDGKTSPSGVLFAGTMFSEVDLEGNNPPGKGQLYAMKDKGSIKSLLGGITISNGLAWTSDEKQFFYIDSMNRKVECFDYDSNAIKIGNRRMIFDLVEHGITGLPDGMTIDVSGNLWVATYGGGYVLNINPNTGALLKSIKLPVPNVTSVAFGGPDMEDLFVTTSNVNLTEEQRRAYPDSGCLFKITGTGARGLPGVEEANEKTNSVANYVAKCQAFQERN